MTSDPPPTPPPSSDPPPLPGGPADPPELIFDAPQAAQTVPSDIPVLPAFTPSRPPRFWRARRFLASANPLRLFLGPVFQRDVRATGRRKGTYFTRLVVLAIPTVFVGLVFLSTANRYSFGYGGSGSAAARIQSLQDIAYAVAVTIAWCQLITLSLVAPLLTAGCVVEERTARTLSAIAASPLSPGRVIGGLFAARMLNLALLALLPLPLILAIRTFGGLETSFILWSFAMAVCAAVALAAVGLWASTRVSRPAAAVSLAILVLVIQWGGPLLIIFIDSAIQGWNQPSTMEVLVASPPAALMMLQMPQGGPMFGFGAIGAAASNCVISLAIATGALLLARWNLARLIATDRVELARKPSRREQRRERKRAMLTGETPVGEFAADSRTVTGNPVMWREMRQSLFAGAWKRWAAIVGIGFGVVLIHALTFSFDTYDYPELASIPCIIAFVMLLLSAAAMPAGAVTTELEARTWATLLTTPLSTYQILLPKIAGALRRLWPPFLFVTLHLLVCAARGIGSPVTILFTLVHFAVFAAFLCCTGVFFSLCSRKSAVASTLNIAMMLGLWLLAPIFFGILYEIFGGSGSDNLVGVFFYSNPVVTYVGGMIGLSRHRGDFDMPGFNSLSPAMFFALWIGSLVSYTGLCAAVMLYAKAAFHRLSTARI